MYVYHCATAPVGMHIANGMYGLIVVEPEGGLPPVDRESTSCRASSTRRATRPVPRQAAVRHGLHVPRDARATSCSTAPSARSSATSALKANVGETVRLFVGNGGPNLISSFHVIGEIFDRAATWGSFSSMAENVQTVSVAPGGATMVEFDLQVPGTYVIVDHALSRLTKGAAGQIVVEGAEAPDIYRQL